MHGASPRGDLHSRTEVRTALPLLCVIAVLVPLGASAQSQAATSTAPQQTQASADLLDALASPRDSFGIPVRICDLDTELRVTRGAIQGRIDSNTALVAVSGTIGGLGLIVIGVLELVHQGEPLVGGARTWDSGAAEGAAFSAVAVLGASVAELVAFFTHLDIQRQRRALLEDFTRKYGALTAPSPAR